MKKVSGFNKIFSVAGIILLAAFTHEMNAQIIRVMPLGNSITQGITYSPGFSTDEGYRGFLKDSLDANGYTNVDFVGSMSNGNILTDRQHEGHPAWYANKATSYSGGPGLGIAAAVDSFLTLNPAEIVLLHIGINDITLMDENPTTNTVAGLVSDVQLIISNIQAHDPTIVVIVAKIINSVENPNITSLITDFNITLNATLVESNTLRIVDMESALNYPDDIIADDPGSKSVHPTLIGYQKMAGVWYQEIKYVIDNILPIEPPIDNNIVINGDYEGGDLSGWTQNNAFGGAVYSFGVNNVNPISGNYDGVLSITTAGTANSRPMITFYLSESMVVGTAYTLRMKTRVISGSPDIQYINYGNGFKSFDALVGDQSWTIDIPSAGGSNNFVTLYMNGTNTGTLGIDEIVLEETVVGNPPVISQHPEAQTVLVGEGASFSVTASGGQPLSYQWRENGIDIGGAASNTYNILTTTLGDNGKRYSCYITNTDGNVLSNEALLTVQDGIPVITQQPASQNIFEGQPVTFTVGATGPGTLSYQWKKNGADIPLATNTSYTIDPVQPTDNGTQYSCVVTNSYGSKTSNAAILTVLETDSTPPNLVSASAESATSVELTFNEIMDGTTATNAANYTINNGITVSAAVLNPAGDKVTLTTTVHTTNSYTVTVNNVEDISGNVISGTQNTANYNYTEPPIDNNIVINGDYEGGDLSGWTQNNAFGGAVYSFGVNNVNPISGNYDGVLSITTAGTANSRPMITFYLSESMVVGTAYTLRMKTRVISGSPDIQYINYGNGFKSFDALVGDQSWTIDIPSAGGSNNFVTLYMNGTNTGTLGIDEIVLEETVVGNPPVISQHPEAQTVLVGEGASFSVTASGGQPLSYQWRENGIDIGGAASNTYNILTTTLGDNGKRYSCYITNTDGNVLSNEALLTVQDGIPVITQQPASQNIFEGQPVTFTVGATGPGTLSYQWKKNGADIPLATNTSYTIDPVQPTDNGTQYSCVVTNSYGSKTSNAAILTVLETDSTPPNLVSASAESATSVELTFNEIMDGTTATNAANYTINNGITVSAAVLNPAGDKVTLTTTVHTTNSYTVTVNNVEDISGNVISGTQNTANYNYTEPPIDNNIVINGDYEGGDLSGWTQNNAFGGAVYSFGVNNVNPISGNYDGVLSITTAGTANSRPMITFYLSESMVVGTAYTLRMKTRVISGSPDIQYINYGNGFKSFDALVGDQSWTIDIPSAGGSNNFVTLYMNGTNTGTLGIDEIVLEETVVGNPPVISQHPEAQTVLVGEGASFSVTASGGQPLSYQWRENGIDIGGAASNTYNILTTTLGDNGKRYSCYITNTDGNVLSNEALLTVQDGIPVITQQPASQNIFEGQPVTFTVGATGPGTLSYQWKKNGADIPLATNTSYTIDPVQPTDNGTQYSCVVTNSYGSKTSNAAILTVLETDSTPPNLVSASAESATSVELTFNEIMDGTTATNAANYTINNGITVSAAVLNPAGDKVTLTTTVHTTNSYTVTVNNVEDISGNVISGTQNTANYNYTEPPINNNIVINGDLEEGTLNGWTQNNAFGGAVYSFGVNNVNPISGNYDGVLSITTAGTANSRPMITFYLSESMVVGTAYTLRMKTRVISGSPDIQYINYGNGFKSFDALVGDQSWTIDIPSAGGSNNFVTLYMNGTNTGTLGIDEIVLEETVVGNPPVISQHPEAQTVLVGEGASFSVTVSGGQPLSYQWRENGIDIGGATSNTYNILTTTLGDNGKRYSCYITNTDGNVLSNEALLTVTDGTPIITSHPISQTILTGQTAVFFVSATGQGTLSYQWQKNNSDISGAINPGYTTPILTQSDNGSIYSCIVSNSFGSDTSDNAILTITQSNGPNITVWYGDYQKFGQLGKMQNQINILGNVSHPDGVASLSYSLNGGSSRLLNIGPFVAPNNIRRLFSQGDFNIEIFVDSDSDLLVDNQNTIVITAQKVGGTVPSNQSQKTIYFDYYPVTNWAMPYNVRLDTLADTELQDYIQITDGKWQVGSNGLRTIEPAYDRVFGIGDINWVDFEVSAKFIAHAVLPKFEKPSYGAGFFILTGWSGHTDDPVPGFDPKAGWQPYGSFCGYSWINQYGARNLAIGGNGGVTIDRIIDNSGLLFETGEFYNMKLRVESTDGTADYFRLKLWPDSESEPTDWILEGSNPNGTVEPESGSVLFIAHHVDMSFYSFDVNPIIPPPTALAKSGGSDRKGELFYIVSENDKNKEIELSALAEKFPKAAFAGRLGLTSTKAKNPINKFESFFNDETLSPLTDELNEAEVELKTDYPRVKIIKQAGSKPLYINDKAISIHSGIVDTINLNKLLENFGFESKNTIVQFEDQKNGSITYSYSNQTNEFIIRSDEVSDTNHLSIKFWALNGINQLHQSYLKLNLLPAVKEIEIPDKYELSQNYPNPFNPETKIRFGLPSESKVKLSVYNILGQLVDLITDQDFTAGYHSLNWNPLNLSSGVYIYKIEAQAAEGEVFTDIKKMMYLK
jgi:hypothetical protein